MEEFLNNLRSVLYEAFPGSELDLEPRSEDRMGGFLVWDGFEELDLPDRQAAIWSQIREHLSPEDQRRINYIFALTPHELAVMQED